MGKGLTVSDSGDDVDIPVIFDAVVVRDEEANRTQNYPPANNPSYVPAPTSTAIVATNNTQNVMIPHHAPPTFSKPTYRNLGRNPTGLHCPYCNRQTITATNDLMGVGTVIAVVILALLFWPICWLPLCMPACRRTHHFCGHQECRQKIGETNVCA